MPHIQQPRRGSRRLKGSVGFIIYDLVGVKVDIVPNNKQVNKFALSLYAGILLWLGLLPLTGMALIWAVFAFTQFVFSPSKQSLAALGWIG